MYCKQCRYDLGQGDPPRLPLANALSGAASPKSKGASRCPECGSPFDPLDPRSYWASADSKRLDIAHQVFTFALLATGLFTASFVAARQLGYGLTPSSLSLNDNQEMIIFTVAMAAAAARMQDLQSKRLAVISCSLTPIIWLAVVFSYYPAGWVLSNAVATVAYLALSVVCAMWLAFPRGGFPRLATATVACLAIFLVSIQAPFALDWLGLHREAKSILAHAEAIRASTGAFPADLDSYQWTEPDRASRMSYEVSFAYDVATATFTDREVAIVYYDLGSRAQIDSDGNWFMYDD